MRGGQRRKAWAQCEQTQVLACAIARVQRPASSEVVACARPPLEEGGAAALGVPSAGAEVSPACSSRVAGGDKVVESSDRWRIGGRGEC
jgi:hypothetical protein